MKATILLALCFLFFFSFTTKPFPAVSVDGSRIISTKPQNHFHKTTILRESEEVLDLNGDLLRPGEKYYIVSAIWGAGGGGVSLPRNGTSSSCPLHVFQEPSDLNYGMPVTFSLLHSSEQVIAVSANVTIKFNVTTTDCDGSTVWKADVHDSETGYVIVTTGGIEGQPSSIFSIQKYGAFYKLVSYKGESVIRYYDSENNQRGLALSDDGPPFMVVFLKADTYPLHLLKMKIYNN